MTGGIDLSAEWAGFRTVGFCEKDEFCQQVLQKHWPGVPIWGDIRDVTAESVRGAGIGAIDLISGGFPCQPFSTAGKRRGKEDDRYLWPEMLRVIKEIRPRWVLGENVAGFVNMALDDALSDLESIDYETAAFVIPACAVGAPHRRDRVWIVAYSAGTQCTAGAEKQGILRGMPADGKECSDTGGSGETQSGQVVANTNCSRCREDWEQRGVVGIYRERPNDSMQTEEPSAYVSDATKQRLQKSEQKSRKSEQVKNIAAERTLTSSKGRGQVKCGLGGMFDGLSPGLVGYSWPAPYGCEQYEWEPPRVTAENVPYRRQKLQALGNAVIPAQVYPILAAIAAIEQARIDRMARG